MRYGKKVFFKMVSATMGSLSTDRNKYPVLNRICQVIYVFGYFIELNTLFINHINLIASLELLSASLKWFLCVLVRLCERFGGYETIN